MWVGYCVCLVSIWGNPGTASGQSGNGGIAGRVLRQNGTGIPGVTVAVTDAGATTITESDGQFSFRGFPAGVYTVTFLLGKDVLTVNSVEVTPGGTTTLEETVDWDVGLTDTLIVRGASRQVEHVVDAQASASLVSETAIARNASHGQLAKLLEFTPGARVAQGDVWDFNVGTRGFNKALNRRVGVLLDGRDVSLPFFGYQGWGTFSFPLDDLSAVELVRGPGAALYGANASGGVISMTSKEPRYSQGGMTRVTFGQQHTANVEGRWAGAVGNEWYMRVVGGARKSDGFAVSRVGGPEYSVACAPATFGDCLPAEVVPFDGENTQVYFGGIRLDKYLRNGMLFTVEGGHSQGRYGVFQSGGQRVFSTGKDLRRPWARVNLKSDRFNVFTSYDGYYTPQAFRGLTTGTTFNSESYRLQLEGQANWRFHQDALHVVAGAAAAVEKIDSEDPETGQQTFLFRPVSAPRQALFGQASWNTTDHVRVVVAGRGDWSKLHDFQLSPKASVSYAFTPVQTVRLTYNRAFQVSNSLEYFLHSEVAPPTDLSALNAFCTPFGVNCGFGLTPVLALGNENLDVEKVRTWEAGYKGVLARNLFLSVDYYRSRSTNPVTSLLPQLGTALGRVNRSFGPWMTPKGLPEPLADQIRTLVPLLSNDLNGSNILAVASYANFDVVNVQGFDVGVNHAFLRGWQMAFTYSWFDFDLPKRTPGSEDLLLPNTPPHGFSAGLSYDGSRFGAGIDARWVDNFRWADGFFAGDVPSYTTVDLTAGVPVRRGVSVGLNVANLFNDRHWEAFGGALLGRRALVSLQYDWHKKGN
jgi:iron complex outermembrane receptor protein